MPDNQTGEMLQQHSQELERHNRKHTLEEQKLRQSEKLLHSIFDAIQDGIAVLDTQFTILKTNKALEVQYIHAAPLPGKKCYAVFQDRQAPCLSCPSLKAINHKQPETTTIPILRAGKSSGWMELHAFPIFDPSHKVIGVVEHFRDVTDRESTQINLRQSRENLEKRVEERTSQLLRLNEKLRLEIEDRKQAERKLYSRDRILKAVTYAAERFLQIAPLESGMHEILQRLAQATDVSRVYIFENHVDAKSRLLASYRYGWRDKHFESHGNQRQLQSIPWVEGGWSRWMEMLSQGKPVVGHVKDFPQCEQTQLIQKDIVSLLVTPIFAGKEWYGFIGFDDCQNERQWSAVEIDALKAAANILGHAIVRQKAEMQIHTLTRELIRAQDDERRKISNYLHDYVAQDLSTLRISCQTLLAEHPAAPAAIKLKSAEIAEALQRSIATIRDLAYDLRPPGLDQLGLNAAIYMFCEDFSKKTGIRVDFNSAGMDRLFLDVDTEINLYRLIQEGLNNIKKHADATRVSIRLVASFPKIILRIQDNGRGFDVEERLAAAVNEKRMGLRSMQERVNLLEGQIKVKSYLNKGTKISIEVPIKASPEAESPESRATDDASLNLPPNPRN
jgi:PAS domain S-box-containing protein